MARSQTDPSQILPGNPSQVLQTNVAGDTVEWVDPIISEEQDNKVRVVDIFVSIFNDLETNKIPEILNSFNALSETIRTVAEDEIVLIKSDIEFQENEPFTELYILKTGKGIQNNIVATDIELINKSREISFISVNGTTTKTITLGFVDGTNLTANWTDEVGGGSSVVVDNALNNSSENPVENQVIEDTFQRTINATSLENQTTNPFFGATYKITTNIPGTSLSGITADADIIRIDSDGTSKRYFLISESLTQGSLLLNYFTNNGSILYLHNISPTTVSGTNINYNARLVSVYIDNSESDELTDIPNGYKLYESLSYSGNVAAGSTGAQSKVFTIVRVKENTFIPFDVTITANDILNTDRLEIIPAPTDSNTFIYIDHSVITCNITSGYNESGNTAFSVNSDNLNFGGFTRSTQFTGQTVSLVKDSLATQGVTTSLGSNLYLRTDRDITGGQSTFRIQGHYKLYTI